MWMWLWIFRQNDIRRVRIRGGACSAKEKPNFCRLGRKFLPFFRSAVVACGGSYACRGVDVTLAICFCVLSALILTFKWPLNVTRGPLTPTYALLLTFSENEIRIHAATASQSPWTKWWPKFSKFWLLLPSTSFDIRHIEVGRKLLSAAGQADQQWY